MGARQRILKLTPYLLLAPGILWLLVFYVYPAIQMFISSFWTGTLETGFTFSLGNWTTYVDALTRYQSQFARSLVYGAAATVICFIIAYPLAYGIAFRGGRYKNVLLFLVIAPFFTSFLLRTQSWKIILGDDGILFGPLKDLHFLPPEFRVLATPAAVDRRHRLQLPAVHDAADLRLAREDRRPARRGGEGPVRGPVATGRHDRRDDHRRTGRRGAGARAQL